MDNFKVIYRILRYLEKAMDYDEADMDFISCERFGITEQRWSAIMEMLVRDGYVDGISAKRSADGEMVVSVSYPRITLKGLEYLNEDWLMQKAADLTRGIAEIIS